MENKNPHLPDEVSLTDGGRLSLHSRMNELEDKLRESLPDTKERADTLNEFAWEIWITDPERARKLTQEGLELAERISYDRGLAFAWRNVGLDLYFRSDVEQALHYQSKALAWFEAHADREGLASVYLALAYLRWGFGDFQKGLDSGLKALELYREIQKKEGQAWAFNALGGFYYDLNNYRESQQYFEQAHDLFRKVQNEIGIGRALTGIGNAYLQMNNHQRALECQNTSLQIHQAAGNKLGESRSLNDIGGIYQSLGQYEEALKYLEASLAIREEIAYSPGETTSLMDIGDIFLKQQRYKEAQDIVSKALVLSEKIRAKPKMCRAHRMMSVAFKQSGQLERALEHYELFHNLEEEVFHEKADRRIRTLEAAYQIEASQKEAEIVRLKNVELREKNNTLQKTVRQLNAAQAQLIHAGKMAALGNLVAGIVHEINTPIGAIRSSSDIYTRGIARVVDLLRSACQGDKLDEDLLNTAIEILEQNHGTMSDATGRVQEILYSLKKFVRLDQAALTKTNINDDLASILTLLGHQFKKGTTVQRRLGAIPEIYSYSGELNQVFMNLLLNAAEATGEDGTITVGTAVNNDHIVVTIADTGKGIPDEKLAQLFEPGFTESSARVRMRTGLFTSYNIIQKHHGDLQVKSAAGEGTVFTILLPADLESRPQSDQPSA